MCELGFGSDSFCLFVCFLGFVRFLFGWLVLFYFLALFCFLMRVLTFHQKLLPIVFAKFFIFFFCRKVFILYAKIDNKEKYVYFKIFLV